MEYWQRSGYYPEWFEILVFCMYVDYTSEGDLLHFMHLVAGEYERLEQLLFLRTVSRVLAFPASFMLEAGKVDYHTKPY